MKRNRFPVAYSISQTRLLLVQVAFLEMLQVGEHHCLAVLLALNSSLLELLQQEPLQYFQEVAFSVVPDLVQLAHYLQAVPYSLRLLIKAEASLQMQALEAPCLAMPPLSSVETMPFMPRKQTETRMMKMMMVMTSRSRLMMSLLLLPVMSKLRV